MSVLVEEFAAEEAEDVEGHFAVPVKAMVREEVADDRGVVAVKCRGDGGFLREWLRRCVEVDRDV